MKRVWLCTLVGLVLFAVQDVMLWAVIFERDQLWQYIGIYHRGWFVMLFALAILGFMWLWPNWKHGLLQGAMLITLAFSGLEDVLYYVIQLRPLPELLPWLDAHPLIFFSPVTNLHLIANVLVWIQLWAIATFYLQLIEHRARVMVDHLADSIRQPRRAQEGQGDSSGQ